MSNSYEVVDLTDDLEEQQGPETVDLTTAEELPEVMKVFTGADVDSSEVLRMILAEMVVPTTVLDGLEEFYIPLLSVPEDVGPENQLAVPTPLPSPPSESWATARSASPPVPRPTTPLAATPLPPPTSPKPSPPLTSDVTAAEPARPPSAGTARSLGPKVGRIPAHKRGKGPACWQNVLRHCVSIPAENFPIFDRKINRLTIGMPYFVERLEGQDRRTAVIRDQHRHYRVKLPKGMESPPEEMVFLRRGEPTPQHRHGKLEWVKAEPQGFAWWAS